MDLDKQLLNVIINQFSIKLPENNGIDNFDFWLKDIELALSLRIKYLIDYDRDKLMHSLYRIDIDENSVKMIFKHSKSELVPTRIARLIIERTAEKLRNYKI